MPELEIARVGILPTCILGEAPHWDEESSSLLYLDVNTRTLFRYYPAGGRCQQLQIEPVTSGSTVTFVIPVEGEPELFLVSMGRDVGLVRWREADPDHQTTKLCTLVTVDQDKPLNRFNDGKCDHKGQLWAGTMGHEAVPGFAEKEKGTVYCFSSHMKPKSKVDKINLSNGLTWSTDRTTFYYIDTGVFSVDAFDYDEATDSVKNRRKLVDYKAVGLTDDFPDGMTIDTDGNIWVANYNGAKLLCIDGRAGGILRTVALPIQNPTCVCWAGPAYDELYVTSTRVGLTPQQLQLAPDNGGVFRVTGLGVRGAPPRKVKLDRALIQKMK